MNSPSDIAHLPLPDRIERLLDIHLKSGAHRSRDKGMCVNEAVAWFAGEPHSDRPACMSRVIGSATMRFNDRLPSDEERDKYLRPLIPTLVGTKTTDADELTRAYMVAEWIVRQRTPVFLRIAGMTAEAEILEGLAKIVDQTTALEARKTARRVRDSLWRARSARRAALREKLAAIADSADSAASAAIADIADTAAIAASAATSADIAAIAASAATSADIADIAASAATSADIADIADIAAIAASAAIADSAATSAAIADSADIAAIAASADIADIAASAAIAAIAASADSADTQDVHVAALRAAAAAYKKRRGEKFQKWDAGYDAAKKMYTERIDEWPLVGRLRAEADRSKVEFVELVKALAAVGRPEPVAA